MTERAASVVSYLSGVEEVSLVSLTNPLPVGGEEWVVLLERILDTLERIEAQLSLVTGVSLGKEERLDG